MRAVPAAIPRAAPLRPDYDAGFGIILLGIFLASSVDQVGLAPPLRALGLVGFAVLVVLNAGAALGVYIGAATIFSMHHFAGQGSWVQRPDNYALLMLVGYLAFARSFGRNVGRFGWTVPAVIVFVAVSMLRLVDLGLFRTHEVSWFMRMFAIPLALYVVLRRAALSLREIRALVRVVAALGVYLGIMSLVEAAGLYSLLVPPWIGDPFFNDFFGLARVGGLFMQPEWNALVLSLTFCAIVMRYEHSRGLYRASWILGGLLVLVAVYFTYTRAAWLGLILAGVPVFWSASAKRGVTVRRRALFLAFCLCFLAVTVLFPSDMTRGRMQDTGTIVYRLHIWAAGGQMILEHPLVGVGFGQFLYHVGRYGQVAALPQIQDPEGLGDLAHNTALSVAAELGLVGLLLYLFIMVAVYLAARRSAAVLWQEKGLLWVAGFAIVYVVNTQFVTAHQLVPNALYFGTMGAIAGCSAARVQRRGTGWGATRPLPRAADV